MRITLCAFADEAASDFDGQIKALKENNKKLSDISTPFSQRFKVLLILLLLIPVNSVQMLILLLMLFIQVLKLE